MQNEKYYYWMDPNYYYGDFSVSKFALIRGEYNDGEKDRDTEEVILWAAYESIEGMQEAMEAEDTDRAQSLIDAYIKSNIGFLPEYEIG